MLRSANQFAFAALPLQLADASLCHEKRPLSSINDQNFQPETNGKNKKSKKYIANSHSDNRAKREEGQSKEDDLC